MNKFFAVILVFYSSLITFREAKCQIINVPGDYPTIQQGIEAAEDGDTVLVQPGIYIENINFKGKNIIVGSYFLITNDPAYISQTVIDGDSLTSVVTFCNGEDLSAELNGFTLTNGIGTHVLSPLSDLGYFGGAIYLSNAAPKIKNLIVRDNSATIGGGIYIGDSPDAFFSNVTVYENVAARSGGGISISSYGMSAFGDSINRCNVYNNYALLGNDFSSGYDSIEIFLDTFSVLNPADYHAYPIGKFEFHVLNGKIQQENADLYVSATGNNANSGLSATDPLKSIRYALAKIMADENNPHVIHLSDGTYGPSSSGEVYPLNMPDYVSLDGESQSGTILDGEQLTAVMRIISNTGTSIKNLTVTNGIGGWESTGGSTAPYYWAGGITMHDHSDLSIEHVRVTDNSSGIYCTSASSPVLDSLTIDGNQGTGLYCKWSCNATVTNSAITNNQGSGISLDQSDPTLCNLIISGNTASGIYYYSSSPVLKNIMIINNSAYNGGGMYIYPGNSNSTPSLENVTIAHNYASCKGGGIHCEFNAKPIFNSDNRCNIYLNEAPLGSDYFAEAQQNVVVDTFTVMYPSSYQAYPRSLYTFDILNSKKELIDADLYVLPDGDNANSGLTVQEPLKNISYAFSRIMADINHQNTIHLMEGTYSTSSSQELFPIYMLDYTNLQGVSEDEVILDGKGQSIVLVIKNNVQNHLSNFTVINGHGNNSWPDGYAGGIVMVNSSVKLSDITVKNNASGGVSFLWNNNSELENVSVINNGEVWRGGGIFINGNGCNPVLKNVLVAGNQADAGGGIYFSSHSKPTLINVTISNNTGYNGYGSILSESHNSPEIYNSIIWNNFPPELNGTFTISYSDIQGSYGGEGNIDHDPLFAGSGDHPCSLAMGSPCINAGNPDTTGLFLPLNDIIGNPRIWNERIDMGAYEWNNVGNYELQITDYGLNITAFPNPFSALTTISYILRNDCRVRLSIYNSFGQMVANPVNGQQQKGKHSTEWSAGKLPAGIYLVRLQAGTESVTRRIVKL